MLRDHNVARVVAARFVSRSGAFAAFFVGIWGKAAFTFDATAGQLAAVIAVAGLSTIAGTVVSGVLVDRFDPKRVLLWSEVAFVPATLSLALATDMIQLTVLVALSGLVTAPILTAIGSFTPFLTHDASETRRINVAMETAAMAALTAGTALGALVETIASVDWVFVFDAATSVVAVILVAGVDIKPTPPGERLSVFGEAVAGLRLTYGDRSLRYYIVIGSSLALVFGTFGALEPLFFRDVVGADDAAILGWVNAVFGIGLILGAASMARAPARVTSARGLAVVIALNGLGVVLYVGPGTLAGAYAGAVVWGFIIGVYAPLVRSLVHLASPRPLVGRVTAVLEVHRSGGELLPLAFVAPLAVAFGVQATLLVAGSVLAAIGLLSLGEAKAVDAAMAGLSRPSPPSRRDAADGEEGAGAGATFAP